VNGAEAKALVSMLALAFPAARFSAENADIYARGISNLDAKETQGAVETLIRSAVRMPSVAEIQAEVASARRERVRLEESAHAGAVSRRPSTFQMPTQAEWAPVLSRMLEADARQRRMVAAWRKQHGLRPLPEEPCPLLDLAKRGAAGKLRELRLEWLLPQSEGR
jgi:hypothetical protein